MDKVSRTKSDRARFEAQLNWVLTIERLRPGVQEKYDCLMATHPNAHGKVSYFWHTPAYQGVYAWGATYNFTLNNLRLDIENGLVRIVKASPGALEQIGLERGSKCVE